MCTLIFFCAFLPAVVFAAGPGIDYSVITEAVDFGDMSAVVLAVAGALAGIYVIIKGVRIALAFVRGDHQYASIGERDDYESDADYDHAVEASERWEKARW